MKKNEIPMAIDAALSHVQPDPWLAQRILQQEREEPIVKKKISVGLVLLIVILLLSTAAFAVVSHFGILDYLPEQRDNQAYVESIITLDQQWQGDYFSATIHEAVFDGMKMTFTMSITPKEGADPVYVIPRIRASANGRPLETWVVSGNGGFHEDGFWVPDIMPDFKYDYSSWAVDVALRDEGWQYAPAAGDIDWEIDFDVLHTDWPIRFTEQDEPWDENEWTDEQFDAYARQFQEAYRQKQVLLNRAGMFGFWLQGDREEGEKYADYCQKALTKEAFVVAERATFRFTANGQPIKTAKAPVAFTLPDGIRAEVTDLHVSASQIGITLRMTRDEAMPSLEEWPWSFVLMAESAKTTFIASSLGPVEEGSSIFQYTAHIMLEGDTDKLILLPVHSEPGGWMEQVTVNTPDGAQQMYLDRALMQKMIDMTPEQEQQAVEIELK